MMDLSHHWIHFYVMMQLETIEEGVRLNLLVNTDNVMIKIPATEAGYIADEGALQEE